MNEQSNISGLKGIGPKTEQLFEKAGIRTIQDLLSYYPRGYDIYEKPVPVQEVQEGRMTAVCGIVYGAVKMGGNPRMQVTTAYIKDLTGTICAIWFRMPYLRNTLKNGMKVTLRGKAVNRKGSLVLEQPEIFLPAESYEEKQNTMQPVYPLTAGLTNNTVIKAVRQALDFVDLKQDFLPEAIRRDYHLAEYNYALRGIHFPLDKESFYYARERLVFEEFLVFVIALKMLKKSGERCRNGFVISRKEEIDRFIRSLPYKLTGAQEKVWEEIQEDLSGEYMMSRLVQGDVGSGKTILALLALLLVALNGYQGALMAPTEVLARQHFLSVTEMLEERGIPLKTVLLTGSMTAREKREACEKISSGEASIIIGTHALIQEKVVYASLALAVTDEQHRFGVRQREMLAGKGLDQNQGQDKGENPNRMPHILVMSATPIPRTLAIILYGDLDISVVDELPANRLPVKNCVVDTGYRQTAYQFLKKQAQEGRQCYVICPMVEESEHLEVENVTDYSQMLQEELGTEIAVGCLHGKMKQKEKDAIMEAFAANEIQVLVSTTVIEVGINVPNATVMMVENAERFGLAQLHQLRGRVGRGRHQSYCIFMSGSRAKETRERLEILNQSNDGFYIANEDLRLRGPGDLFGIRQSGILDFQMADVFQDAKILQSANEAAGRILKEDSGLIKEEHQKLKKHVKSRLRENLLETTL